ncbi:MAG: hypothetical protein ACYC8T_02875 [Myxococcaceae bacterium]
MGSRLKPQDVLVALKLSGLKPGWRYQTVASELAMSASEVHGSVKRLIACRLFNPILGRIDLAAFRKFLVHGIAHVFPAEPSEMARGVPTSASAPPLSAKLLQGDDDRLVWADEKGNARGRRIEPLYRSAPVAAAKDPALYELLALVDALRAGRARERRLAEEELTGRLQ